MTELNPIYLAQKAFIVLALLLAACLSPQKDPGPPVQQRTVVHEELKAPAGERMARVEELRQSLNDIRYAPEDLGFEYKAKPNTFLRLESRYIQLNNKEDIFLYNGNFSNTRWEFVSSMGVWF